MKLLGGTNGHRGIFIESEGRCNGKSIFDGQALIPWSSRGRFPRLLGIFHYPFPLVIAVVVDRSVITATISDNTARWKKRFSGGAESPPSFLSRSQDDFQVLRMFRVRKEAAR